ncbi:acyltransferase family protein [Bosea sp. BH3]|uniref:acyltransferase family protein n=1 Tax=Bosea sp. BH3 TaxID=2871701 RepID=UPI0021CB06E4|nr:acyltransferase [Bosea sp. BH3]MCU4181125.1 acyltransferase [Bosea sp. BH3]
MKESDAPTGYYYLLDALRGIAAFAVVGYHLGHWLGASGIAPNGNLAVDLFYALSGLVLSSAYRGRVETLSTGAFLAQRVARLLPMIVLGVLVSAAYIVLRAWLADARSHVADAGLPVPELVTAIILGSLNLPYFGAPRAIGGPELFPLNGPQYTLFFEVFVNVLWWQVRSLHSRMLFLAACAICLPLVMMFGLGGANIENFLSGFPRVILCFSIGVLIFEYRDILLSRTQTRLGFGIASLTAAYIALVAPPVSAASHIAFILLVTPALLFFGMRIELTGRWRQAADVLGRISYPVYILHYPFFCWINGLYRIAFGDKNILIQGPIVLLCVAAGAYLAHRLFERPASAWLRAILSRRPARDLRRA